MRSRIQFAVLVLFVAVFTWNARTSSAATSTTFSPYVDIGQTPMFNLAEVADESGIRSFTVGFVRSYEGCNAAWSGYEPLSSRLASRFDTEIAALRRNGGDVIVSFGGAYGVELARVCPSSEALRSEYAKVVAQYDLTAVDFDIEGVGASDSAANERRSRAIAALQRDRPDLAVSFTVPAGRPGFSDVTRSVIQSAIDNGVRITRINLMTMYFNEPGQAMTDLVIVSTERSAEQLRELFPSQSFGQIRSLIGITPLIGRNNDYPQETFRYADARAVTTWARQQGIGLLSMWSLHRDQACDTSHEYERDACSGLPQDQFAYAHAFMS
jgi:hypothetical protein